jgi:hypothetical protein
MSKTKPWPTDIQIAATDAARSYLESGDNGWPLSHVIARALLEERERCAKVAESDRGVTAYGNDDYGPNVARRIASAIRSGK